MQWAPWLSARVLYGPPLAHSLRCSQTPAASTRDDPPGLPRASFFAARRSEAMGTAFGTAHCHAARRRLAVARTFSLPWGVPRWTYSCRGGAHHGRRSPSEHPRQRPRELVEEWGFGALATGLGTGWRPWRLNPARRRLREAFGMQRGGITEHTCYEGQYRRELDGVGAVLASQTSHSR